MQNLNRPKVRVIALGKNGHPSGHDDQDRHGRLQRHLVVAMGLLWLLAFATGCSRNSKNCSAYDGVTFEQTVLPGAEAPQN